MITTRSGAPLHSGAQNPSNPSHNWMQFHNRYLQNLPLSLQQLIFKKSQKVAAELEEWARQYDFMRRERLIPLALSVTAATPVCEVEELVATARTSLWVFALDDLFDEGGLSQAELTARVATYRALVRGLQVVAADEYGRALLEIRRTLSAYPIFSFIGPIWAEAICRTMNEMQREAEWRDAYAHAGVAALPPYSRYLQCGRYSIGGPPHIWSAIITLKDNSVPHILSHLTSMERIASTCIRLANDLRSYAKEAHEGNINSLTILTYQYATGPVAIPEAFRQAYERVQADIEFGLAQLKTLEAAATSDTRQPEAAISNIAHFVCEFYQDHDFHTFLSAFETVNGALVG